MSELTTNQQELVEFFRIQPSDLEVLARLREPFEGAADACVEEFYQHLLRFNATKELLRSPGVRERLMVSQRKYLISLTDPIIDSDYMQQRVRIGSTHERVGLETRWYLGAYALYFSLLIPVIREALKPDEQQILLASTALMKRLEFDAEIAIMQYTDRREQDLRRLNQELRDTGKALTLEMDQTTRDLRRTEARARAAEQLASVATLVSGLAHEVGTPMGVIRGHAEALEDSVEGERARWRLNMIQEQIDRITNIVQSLLNIARPRESLVQDFSLEEVINTTLTFISEKLKRRSIEVVTELEQVPLITGDPEKMQQVFLNLFINAIDAMPDGGKLGIFLGSVGEAMVIIRIKDSGSGITDNDIRQIFEPFYTTKEAGHGNGLGLVVVKGIVEDQGGEIEVNSEAGTGSEFVIRIPIEAAGNNRARLEG
jgi:signal transduction histidine kinase